MSGRIKAGSTPPPSGKSCLTVASKFAVPPGMLEEGMLQILRSSGLEEGISRFFKIATKKQEIIEPFEKFGWRIGRENKARKKSYYSDERVDDAKCSWGRKKRREKMWQKHKPKKFVTFQFPEKGKGPDFNMDKLENVNGNDDRDTWEGGQSEETYRQTTGWEFALKESCTSQALCDLG